MTQERDGEFSIEDQARLLAMEALRDPTTRAAAMRWCNEDPERRAAFDKAEAALTRLDPAARRIRARQRLLKVAIAASVAGLIAVGASLGLKKNEGNSTGHHDIAGETNSTPDTPLVLTTQRGEVRDVTLADGSVVTLDTNSRLLVWMRPDRRDLELDHGRVHFIVAHDRSRPFTVVADGGATTALGTVFDVERRSRCEMKVVLFKGQVTVSPPCATQRLYLGANKRYLKPGERMRYLPSIAQAASIVPDRAPKNEGQWVTGVKSYEDETVGSILAEVNLYSSVQLIAATPEVASMRVSADLHIRNPETVAKHLARSLGLTLEFHGTDRIVLKK
ncbi:MAG: FecR domain-containing protein [Sphingopyxis sp.]|mgnify:FL=1|uniref:FecR family protein n=1 Tax=Alphaproteobacteria TaxID=28211 RepID=UPI000C442506|nr:MULTISPECIES: FecR domain-containing protein [Alphaproteobacteria]MBJ7442533.1 FecR domain-containing protein [Sphingopyxis sp.]MBS87317.1 anti-sigma factor [Sphingobium sp.]PZU12175.1 MAG: anti-sigma factor [Sphingobium sp.]TAJ29400.1 MAG: anti-sigma factor [Bosea sp. (in: a-proteobacteria)]|tara:strand:- start:813 stop:1814 length:1002 start_codon:yes stop_codon:yes gene_type:complete